MQAGFPEDAAKASTPDMSWCLDRSRRLLELIDASSDMEAVTRVYRQEALSAARRLDAVPVHERGALWGVAVTLKDLIDVAGDVTAAGCLGLADRAPAARDATIVARLRAADALILGRTGMSELAFSALGLNPHFGSPKNAIDASRIPGGSSSGAAVAVALGLCDAAIGSDTGGSIRLPAAFNGVVGFKPTQARIPRDGTVALSESQDTIGPLAANVAMCALVDAVMAGEGNSGFAVRPLAGVRIAVPTGYLTDDLDADVAHAFERSLKLLEAAGARLIDTAFPEGAIIAEMLSLGGLVGPEAYREHSHLLRAPERMDPLVVTQLRRFTDHPEANYSKVLQLRRKAQSQFAETMAGLDILACPTVAVGAPHLTELAGMDATLATNRLLLRNTSPFNTLDAPAISLPCHQRGEPAVGLMLVGRSMGDRQLLEIAAGAEAVLPRF